MAYEKQNFKDGEVLTASQLNKMDVALHNINPFLGSELGNGLYSLMLLKQGDVVIPMWSLVSNEIMYTFEQEGAKVSPHNIYSYKSLYTAKCTQDGVIYNGKVYLGQGTGQCFVIDLATGASKGTLTWDKKDILLPHDNSMSLSIKGMLDALLSKITWTESQTIDSKTGEPKTGGRAITNKFSIKDFSGLSINITNSNYVICCYDEEGTYLGQPSLDKTTLQIGSSDWVTANTPTLVSELLAINNNIAQLAIISYNPVTPTFDFTSSTEGGVYFYSNIYNSYASSSTDKHIGECCVYKLNDDTTYTNTLVQLIKIGFVDDTNYWPPISHARPFGNFIVDNDANYLYAYVMYDNKGTQWYKFRLPEISEGEDNSTYGCKVVTLTTEDILDSWVTPYMGYVQGADCFKGLLYTTEGFSGNSSNARPTMRVIDPTTKSQIAKFDLYGDGIIHEPEFIDFCDGKMYYGTPHHIYLITLY